MPAARGGWPNERRSAAPYQRWLRSSSGFRPIRTSIHAMTRIALFGCGRIGTVHAESVAAHPDAELAWVCDPMEGPAKELAGRHGAQATVDVAAVLADDGVDAVIIGSP